MLVNLFKSICLSIQENFVDATKENIERNIENWHLFTSAVEIDKT